MRPDTPPLKTCTDLSFVSPGELVKHAQDVSDEVVRRAYELFEKRGRTYGSDWGDWFLAQSQVLKQVNFHVQAHAEEIKISVEPRRVRICGRAETPDNHKAGEEIMYSLDHSLMPANGTFAGDRWGRAGGAKLAQRPK
jgi:hypothetical protein